MYINRSSGSPLQRLLQTFPAVVIVGARQVGKSTLIKNTLAQDAEFVVFDPVVDVENARRDPELFFRNHRTPLVLDEIQYAPELIPVLKRRIDGNRAPGQYVLSGSQQWGVLKAVAESLAGRAVFLDLEGFTLAELGRSPGRPWLADWLDDPEGFIERPGARLSLGTPPWEQLWRGFLPEAQRLPVEAVPDFHAAYLRTYVERDARLLAEVSDWQAFGRFARLAAALTAQEINHSQFGRELGVSPETARRWLAVLTATFQWHEVPSYSGNAVKRVSGKPKGYIADTGFACAAQAISSPGAVPSHPLWGPLFETAVAAEIRKACALLSPRPNLYHWRTHGGAEVDLLLERDGRFYPLEAKANSRPTRGDTTGMTAFRKTYPGLKVEKGLVIAPAEGMVRLSENDYAIPWDLGPETGASDR